MLHLRTYTPEDQPAWDALVEQSPCATFLHRRGFMGYHADRFQDASIMVFRGEKLLAVLPANQVGEEVYSHQGLTYGGLIMAAEVGADMVLRIFEALLAYLREQRVARFHYRQLPSLYAATPQGAEDYALWQCGATLVRRDLTLAAPLGHPPHLQQRRMRGVKKAAESGLSITRDAQLDGFWREVLEPTLQDRHGVTPVHTAEEIQLLHDRFPDQIQQYVVRKGAQLLGGSTLFITPRVVHAQYIAATAEGRKQGALDLLFDYLLHEEFQDRQWLNFGIVNEEEGRVINSGLLEWKESFGALPFVHNFYRFDLS